MDKEILLERTFKQADAASINLSDEIKSDIENGLWKDAFTKTEKTKGSSGNYLYTVKLTLIKDRNKDKGLQEYLNSFKTSKENPDIQFSVNINTPFYLKGKEEDGKTQDVSTNARKWWQFLLVGIPIGSTTRFKFKDNPVVPLVDINGEEVAVESWFFPTQNVSESFTLPESSIDEFIDSLKSASFFKEWFSVEKIKVKSTDLGEAGNEFEEVVRQYIMSRGEVDKMQAAKLIPITSHLIRSNLSGMENNPIIEFMFNNENIKNGFLKNPEKAIVTIKALINGFNKRSVTPQRLKNTKYIAFNPSFWDKPENDMLKILNTYDWLATSAQYSSEIGSKKGFEQLQQNSNGVKEIVKGGVIDFSKMMTALLYNDGDPKKGVRDYKTIAELLDALEIDEGDPNDIIGAKKNKNGRTTTRTGRIQSKLPDKVDDTIIQNLGIDPKIFKQTMLSANAEQKAHLMKLLKDLGVTV